MKVLSKSKIVVAILLLSLALFGLVSCMDTPDTNSTTTTETPTHQHTWVNADCTTPKTCSECGETQGFALGHAWQDADCDSPRTCTRCSITVGSAKGHTWQDATCTAPKTCSVCFATEGSANGHNLVDGICTVCGQASTITYAEYIAASDGTQVTVEGIVTGLLSKYLGDTNNGIFAQDLRGEGAYYVYGIALDPVLKMSLNVGDHIVITGEKTTYQGTVEIVNATIERISENNTVEPVDYTDIFTNATSLTAPELVERQSLLVTIKGVTIGGVNEASGYYYFSLAGKESYLRVSGTICPLDVADTATFIANHKAHEGWLANVTGIVSLYNGAFYLQPVSLSAEEYISGGGSEECDHQWQDATCTAPKTCFLCGETEGSALGHAWQDANCYTPKHCTRCGETEGETSHSWYPADCDTPKTCSICGKTEGDALGHDWQNATCQNPRTCSVCGEIIGSPKGHVFKDGVCIDCGAPKEDAHVHTWQNATCTTPKTCTGCGVTEGKAKGHTWLDATCEAPKTCSVCGETEGNAKGHTWQDATCTTPKTCSVCGKTEGSPLDHTWEPAGCTTPQTCTVCGTTVGNPAGHNWVPADCDTPKTCSECGATEGNPLGHSYGDTYTYDLANHSVACDVCGSTTEGAHNFVDGYCDVCHMSNFITMTQFNEYGLTFASGKYSTLKYRLTGTIIDILDVEHGEVYIQDENGNILYIGCLYVANNRTEFYSSTGDRLAVGDTIVIQTKCGNSGGVAAAFHTNLLSFTHNIIDTYIRHDDVVYMGYYPQVKITDENLIATLNDKAGGTPATNPQGWTDYGYRLYNSTVAFMWYIDVEDGIDTYRGVYLTSYRPKMSATNTALRNQGGFELNTIYWFKYEPLKWDILKEEDGKAFLLSRVIIDSQYYHKNQALRSEDTAIYANNYMRSDIRAWLNQNFYHTAFSTTQKSLILTTNVNNGLSSTGDSTNPYICSNTQDKIFLLSREEAFDTSVFADNASRQKTFTNYALSQGCYKATTSPYGGQWWLRTPGAYAGIHSQVIKYNGINAYNEVNTAETGVVPAMWIALN